MKREPSSAAIGFGPCAITAIVVTPLCGHWFSCGCDWPWDRFFMACDALARNAPLPHCPWCVHPLAAVASVSLSLGTATLAALNMPHLPAKPVDTLYRLGIGTAISVGVLCLGAWLTALATGHPGFGGASLHRATCKRFAVDGAGHQERVSPTRRTAQNSSLVFSMTCAHAATP